MLSFISKYGTLIIIIFGIVLLFFMIRNTLDISGKRNLIKQQHDHIRKKYKKNKQTHELIEEVDDDSLTSPEKFLEYEKDFNSLCSWHNTYAQLIPIFPLLGILGTVSGLMLNTQANNTAELFGSLNTALDTTFWGLVSAIILKAFDALAPSRFINDVNIIFDDYYGKLNIAETFGEIEEKVKK